MIIILIIILITIDIGCKGLVLCKIKNRSLCPIDLVKRIFNRVKSEKQPISRWVSRIIPLSHVFYPNEVSSLSSLSS